MVPRREGVGPRRERGWSLRERGWSLEGVGFQERHLYISSVEGSSI